MREIRLSVISMCLAAFALGFAICAATAWSDDNHLYPDGRLSPGVIDPSVTQTQICTAGYTAGARNVSEATKKAILTEYGVSLKDAGKYEVDHRISLELGGSNDPKNLWAQPYTNLINGENLGARQKDVVETGLKHQICKKQITMSDAQYVIVHDWVGCYHAIKAKQACAK
jgi:hypothetical protein